MSDQMALVENCIESLEIEDTASEVTGEEESSRGIGHVSPFFSFKPWNRSVQWLDAAARQFRAIAILPDGWDSHVASRVDLKTLQSGFGLLVSLAYGVRHLGKPYINPTPSGGVQFHWEAGHRYLEIEVLDPYTARFYYVDQGENQEAEGELRVGESVERALRYLRFIEGAA